MASIRAPTLVAYGDYDPLRPLSILIGASLPAAAVTVEVFERCGHRPMAECREQLDRVLIPFLRDHGETR